MFIISDVFKDAVNYQSSIKAVADMEALIQSDAPWNYSAFIELLEQESIQLIVGRINDCVVGYCLYQVVFEQAEVLRIGTHPDYQRQGIASQLFDKLHKKLKDNKVESLLLEVRADNAPAIALYEYQGLVEIYKRKDYYQMPYQQAVDALIMQCVYG